MEMDKMSEEMDMDSSEESPTEDKKEGPEEYEIECAVNHVIKAEEIKADAKLWPYVKKELDKKGVAIKAAIKSLKDLDKVAYEKSKEA